MFLSFSENDKYHLDMLNEILSSLNIHFKGDSPMRNDKATFEVRRDEMVERVGAINDAWISFKTAMELEGEGVTYFQTTGIWRLFLKGVRCLFEHLLLLAEYLKLVVEARTQYYT